MSRSERLDQTSAIVQASGRVRVADLSSQLNVSEMTVRRDLEELEERGIVMRVHGGAVSSISRSFEPGFDARAQMNTAAKARIGPVVAELVRNGDTIILDAGSTTLHVAESFGSNIIIRAMALSLRLADILVDMPNVTLMVPGGMVRAGERSFVGGMAVEAFSHLTFDTAILSCGGVDVDAGVTEYEYDDSETKRAAVRSARRVILAADGSKLGAVAFARVCSIEQIDILVTDRNAPSARVDTIRQTGVEVILA